VATRKTDDSRVLFTCGSVMCPRRIARYTRHAIALATAKYVDPRMGFIVPGMLGEAMRAVEAIATPIVTLVYPDQTAI
jgi:hypothetical protein